MINLIVVTHGEFGAYLIEAAESIIGLQSLGVRAVSISPRLSIPELRERLGRAIRELASPEGLVVLTDMPGGTAVNLAFPLIKDERAVGMVSGVNLYMLVSAFSHRRRLGLGELIPKIMADAQKSIRDIRQMFVSRVS